MPSFRSTHVEVYLFRRRGRRAEFLLLRRSAVRRALPGIWQPVTGKRRTRERMFAAAVREVREETGLTPRRWWALETMTHYPDVVADVILALPLFAAELGFRETIRLSREHDASRWVSAVEAKRLVLWESQRRGIEAVRREVLGNARLATALEIRA
jgi:dATP pyrophosphohydrolase